MEASIASKVSKCLQLFKTLSDLTSGAGLDVTGQSEETASAVIETKKRFAEWARITGAHQENRKISLDQRLSGSSDLKDSVMSFLDKLADSLTRAIGNASHEDGWSPTSSDSELSESGEEFHKSLPPEPKAQQLLSSVSVIITSLSRLAMTFRNPAPIDRYIKSQKENVSQWERTDTQYVQDKFPNISDKLARTMVRATLQRRQFLGYSQSHQGKLAHGLDLEGDLESDELALSDTNASFIPGQMPMTELPQSRDFVDSYSRSETSFATSGQGADPGKLRVPNPPKDILLGAEPFKCPYCFLYIDPPDTKAWDAHVYRDLLPFACTFEDCTEAEHLFGSRRDWFDHELVFHRKEWMCINDCVEKFSSQVLFEEHLRQKHGYMRSDPQFETQLRACQRRIAPDASARCPFCGEDVSTRREIERHIGRHQMSLALWVLPRLDPDKSKGAEQQDVEIKDDASLNSSNCLGDDLLYGPHAQDDRDAISNPLEHSSRGSISDIKSDKKRRNPPISNNAQSEAGWILQTLTSRYIHPRSLAAFLKELFGDQFYVEELYDSYSLKIPRKLTEYEGQELIERTRLERKFY